MSFAERSFRWPGTIKTIPKSSPHTLFPQKNFNPLQRSWRSTRSCSAPRRNAPQKKFLPLYSHFDLETGHLCAFISPFLDTFKKILGFLILCTLRFCSTSTFAILNKFLDNIKQQLSSFQIFYQS